MNLRTFTRPFGLAVALSLTAGAITSVGVPAAEAAIGCRVNYQITNQWPGGFGAAVSVTNLGDALSSWRLTWTQPAGQSITQLWNGTLSQSGNAVAVANVSWNGAIATGATASFGFNGSSTATAVAPASFALNGSTCTGTTGPGTTPTGAPTTAAPSTSPPVPSTSRTAPSTTTPATSPTIVTGTPPAGYPNPGRVLGDTGVHDPSVVKAPNGTYILVHTGDNIAIKTSADRITWRNAGVVFPGGAPWTTSFTGGGKNLWAPDISYHNGQFWLYYSASTFGSDHSAIFLATSPTGLSGTWTDRGQVIQSGGTGWNAIDPNLVVTSDGQWWLSFGSFWNGIQMVRLDPGTGRRSDNQVVNIARRPSNGGAVEASYVVQRNGWYYLYVSFDLCCKGASSTYRIMVGRSRTVTGPYVDRAGKALTDGGGTQVLAGNGSIHGPGHEAVLADTDGDVLVYHYYADNGASLLGINLLGYDSAGWPYVW